MGKSSINGPFSMAMLNNQITKGYITCSVLMHLCMVAVSYRYGCCLYERMGS